MAFDVRIQQALKQRQADGLYRQQRYFVRQAGSIAVGSQPYINFSSNDYLGLATDKQLKAAWQHGIDAYGCGSSASPMVTGASLPHQNLQAQLCEWLGFEKAVLFNSGFSANQALLFSLLQKDDLLIQDKFNHASLIEAGVLSPATMLRFKHNSTDDLQRILAKATNTANKIIVSEGVFSMDGDSAPLAELSRITNLHRAWLALDDAHGIGVLGETGGGLCEEVQQKPNILIVTFGKALGVAGAAILCDRALGDYLTQFARHYVYSTAMPPAQAYCLSQAISMTQTQGWRRDKLASLAEVLKAELNDYTQLQPSDSAIHPWLCGSSEQAIHLSNYLQQQGLWVSAIRPPTVPPNTSRLRMTLNTNHSEAEVKQLACCIKRYYEHELFQDVERKSVESQSVQSKPVQSQSVKRGRVGYGYAKLKSEEVDHG